jgi:hypothetical protein
MDNETRLRLPLIVQCFIFLIPVNIYVIGNWLGAGAQWFLFRYQQTYLGDSFIFFYKDLEYVQMGILSAKSTVSAEISFIASLCLVLATLILIAAMMRRTVSLGKTAAVITVFGGFLFLVADAFQYGILFNGPAGLVFPVGVPVMIASGYLAFITDFSALDNSENAEWDSRQ